MKETVDKAQFATAAPAGTEQTWLGHLDCTSAFGDPPGTWRTSPAAKNAASPVVRGTVAHATNWSHPSPGERAQWWS